MNNTKINNHANLIWSIADKLTGVYKPHEYGLVILPMTVLRRFDIILEKDKQEFLDKAKTISKDNAFRDKLLKKASGHQFYNESDYTIKTLIDDTDHLSENFNTYIEGYSEEVKQILLKYFKFGAQIDKLNENNLLYIVLKEMSTVDLHPNTVSNIEMGYIFEELIRRFSEAHNEDAGQHYTPREVIRLMINILFSEDRNILAGKNIAKTIYDPACGTGGMLTVAEEYLRELNKDAKLITFGQEINDETYAICKSDILIKGLDAENVKIGNTLSNDQFKDVKFDYIISNPPFGREWKKDKEFIEREARQGMAGRFGYGLPAVSDGQMLFLCHAISKMKDIKDGGSRIAIIHNGSPLFNGDAGSGPSEIRRHILENDLLETIISLPNDIFYNTGITTYLWILDNNKPKMKKGKVQLIDANKIFKKMRKSLGNKRNEISEEQIKEITRIYGEYKEGVYKIDDKELEVKIFDNDTFGYSKVVVNTPLKDEKGNIVYDKKGNVQIDKEKTDTENIPFGIDFDEYMQKNVLPYNQGAFIDKTKTKIGYEIPFTRFFYKYTPPRDEKEIFDEIKQLEKQETSIMKELFGNE